MRPLDRALRAILLLAIAGMIVCLSMLTTAAVGVTVGSTSPTIPTTFVGLLWALCAAMWGPAAWLLARAGRSTDPTPLRDSP